MARKIAVRITANFERNLGEIETFLQDAGATRAFDDLLDQLLDTAIPNLERFPDLGRPFLARAAGSVEGTTALDGLKRRLGAGELREYLLPDYLLLYVRYANIIHLLSIKHHRQLSFDFDGRWGNGQPG